MAAPMPIDPHLESAENEPPALTGPPRLGIIHLMLWMLGSALVLASRRAINQMPAENPETSEALPIVFMSIHSILAGTAIGSLSLFWSYHRRQLAYPCQPGHWLLVIEAIANLVGMAGYFAVFLVRDDSEDFRPHTVLFHAVMGANLAYHLLRAGPLLFAGVLQSRFKMWFAALMVMALANLSQWAYWFLAWIPLQQTSVSTLIGLMQIILWSPPVLTIIALLVAVVVDLVARTRRDWAHWLGVGVFAASAALHLGEMAVGLFS